MDSFEIIKLKATFLNQLTNNEDALLKLILLT